MWKTLLEPGWKKKKPVDTEYDEFENWSNSVLLSVFGKFGQSKQWKRAKLKSLYSDTLVQIQTFWLRLWSNKASLYTQGKVKLKINLIHGIFRHNCEVFNWNIGGRNQTYSWRQVWTCRKRTFQSKKQFFLHNQSINFVMQVFKPILFQQNFPVQEDSFQFRLWWSIESCFFEKTSMQHQRNTPSKYKIFQQKLFSIKCSFSDISLEIDKLR